MPPSKPDSEVLDEESTAQVNIIVTVLDEIVELRAVVDKLAASVDLVRNEQQRQGKVLESLRKMCAARAKLCGVVAEVSCLGVPSDADNGR